MKTLLTIAALLITSSAHASPRVRVLTSLQPGTVVLQGTQVLVVTPIAVPVGIPVAPLAVTYYQAVTPGAIVQPQAAPPAEAKASVVQTLVQKTCAGCHGADKPKGDLNLTGELDDATRLKAIGRVLADDAALRMPRGKTLDATTLGLVIQELAKKPAAPPIPPEGE